MSRIFFSMATLLFTVFSASAQNVEYSYLKILIENEETISYPPETGFLVQDAEGTTILNPNDLERLKTYKIEKPITLFVFVSWDDEPHVYPLKNGTLVLGKTDRTYAKTTKKDKKTPPKDHFSRPIDGDYVRAKKNDQSNKKKSDRIYLKKERYFSYDEKTGYDASLEFSNGVIFYFRDGKAIAWEHGKLLNITGKYLIKTDDGLLKISFRPMTKKMWWVFEKN